jgi:DNA-binding transcriptional LysR family regulator
MMMDMNLFRVFEAVMTERHVGRAAARIHRTQPAVSNAIRRLRDVFHDPLFVRASDGMRPTARALEIWRDIAPALTTLSTAAHAKAFDAAQVDGVLTIACTDFEASLLLGPITRALARWAPAIDLVLLPGGAGRAEALLQSGQADVSIGYLPIVPNTLRSTHLFDDAFAVVMRKAHPLRRQGLTMARFCKASHVLVSPVGQRSGFVDDLLAQQGKKRHVAVVVNHFHLVPSLLAGTDHIATSSSRLMKALDPAGLLHVAAPPLPMPAVPINLYWHQRADADRRMGWCRQLLVQCCKLSDKGKGLSVRQSQALK